MGITNDSSLWKRSCPICLCEIEYKSYSGWFHAVEKNDRCRSCSKKYGNGLGSVQSNQRKNEISKIPKPTQSPTLFDIYWAAGFIEGEGSFNGGAGSMVEITQKNLEPLQKMQRLFGGTISDYSKKRYHKKRYKKDGYYRWRLYGARARGLQLTVYSMMTKRRQKQLIKYMKGIFR